MTLPQHPSRLRRVRGDVVPVWRTATTLQVGLDDDVLVLEPVPPLADQLLQTLTSDGQFADSSDASRLAWQHWLLDRLDEHGLLAGAAPAARIRVLGSGDVAHRIATLLVDLGHTVQVRDPTPLPGTRRTQGMRLVGQLRRTPRRHGGRAVVDTGGAVALTVVCTGTCEPDRSVTDSLARDGGPYLVVRTRPGTAVAGPLVVPAQTSCVRCADLWRAQADPAWPRLAAQLAHRLSPDDPLLDAWVAAVSLAQITAFLHGEPGELRSRTLTLSADTGRTTLRAWPRHPDCTCHGRGRELGNESGPDRIGA